MALYTMASCGCMVVAVGAPTSKVRREIECSPCGRPTCPKLTEEEYSGFSEASPLLITDEAEGELVCLP